MESAVANVSPSLFPDEKIGNMTINEILGSADANIIKQGNRISVRYKTDSGVFTMEYAGYNAERLWARTSRLPAHGYKKDLENDIREMKQQGYLQKDIAFELGISESYVSMILRNKI